MVLSFKIEDGGLVFDSEGKVEMIGEPNAFSLEEMLQRIEIRFKTLLLSDRWRPYEGFDLKSITDNDFNTELAGVSRDEIIRSVAFATILQDPEVYEVDEIEVGQYEYGRDYFVKIKFRTTYDESKSFSFKTDVLLL